MVKKKYTDKDKKSAIKDATERLVEEFSEMLEDGGEFNPDCDIDLFFDAVGDCLDMDSNEIVSRWVGNAHLGPYSEPVSTPIHLRGKPNSAALKAGIQKWVRTMVERVTEDL